MGELEQRMREQERERDEHLGRMAAMADEARRNLLGFVGLMREHRVPTTWLHHETSEFVRPEPVKRFLRRSVPQEGRVEYRYEPVGRGWVVRRDDYESTESYLVLEEAVAHRCRLPRLPRPDGRSRGSGLVDPPHLRQPYVVASGPLDGGEVFAFHGAMGVDLLARNARELLGRG